MKNSTKNEMTWTTYNKRVCRSVIEERKGRGQTGVVCCNTIKRDFNNGVPIWRAIQNALSETSYWEEGC